MKKFLIAGNWKMNKTSAEAAAFAEELKAKNLPNAKDVCVMAPFTSIEKLGKGLEGSLFFGTKIPDGFVKADHTLLDDILVVRTDQKIAARLGADKILVFVQDIVERLSVSLLRGLHDLLVSQRTIGFKFIPAVVVFRHGRTL